MPTPAQAPQIYRVYIDESGDRGLYSQKSPYFILGAVIAREVDRPDLERARDGLCRQLGKPVHTVLHWSDNLKGHPTRKEVASSLSEWPLVLAYVVVDKASIRRTRTGLGDHARLYNYAVRRLLERVSWFVDDQIVNAQRGRAFVSFAHVRNFNYAPFHAYLTQLRSEPKCSIRWRAIIGTPRIEFPSSTALLQLADIASGVLAAALVPDKYDRVEYSYLDPLQGKIYRRPPASILTYGLHVICGDATAPNCVQIQPWWPSFPGKN